MQSRKERRKGSYTAKVEAGARPLQYSPEYVSWKKNPSVENTEAWERMIARQPVLA